jgi:cytochrome c553
MKQAVYTLLFVIAAFAHETSRADAPTSATKVENPFRGVMQDRAYKSSDEALYVEKCSMCHRQMGMGTVILARRMEPKLAQLEARDDLTPEFVAAAVRGGIGNMPRIGRGEVSEAQLTRIAAYLTKRKRP